MKPTYSKNDEGDKLSEIITPTNPTQHIIHARTSSFVFGNNPK